MVVRIFYFQLEVSNEASKQMLPRIHSKNI